VISDCCVLLCFSCFIFIVNYYCCFMFNCVLRCITALVLPYYFKHSVFPIYLSVCVTWVVPGINALIGWLSAFWRIITFIVYTLQQFFKEKKKNCCLANSHLHILPNLPVKDRKCRYRGIEISVENKFRYFDSLLIVDQLITETSYRWLVLKFKHLAHVSVSASVSHVLANAYTYSFINCTAS